MGGVVGHSWHWLHQVPLLWAREQAAVSVTHLVPARPVLCLHLCPSRSVALSSQGRGSRCQRQQSSGQPAQGPPAARVPGEPRGVGVEQPRGPCPGEALVTSSLGAASWGPAALCREEGALRGRDGVTAGKASGFRVSARREHRLPHSEVGAVLAKKVAVPPRTGTRVAEGAPHTLVRSWLPGGKGSLSRGPGPTCGVGNDFMTSSPKCVLTPGNTACFTSGQAA